MKLKIITCLLLLTVIGARCVMHKKAYVIPADYMGATRDNLDKMLAEGQKLYKIYCSGCHGIFSKGKDSVPDFSKTQIEGYKASALLDDPKNHSVAMQLRAEDLDLILQFLSFRKTSAQ